MKKIKFRLTIYYIISILIVIIGFVFTASHVKNFISNDSSIILERYAILITLAAIPLALKLFHRQVKKLNKTDISIYLKKYQTLYVARLLILVIICAFNITCLYITASKNFYFLIIITIFAFFLCFPQKIGLDYNKIDNN